MGNSNSVANQNCRGRRGAAFRDPELSHDNQNEVAPPPLRASAAPCLASLVDHQTSGEIIL
jgi:hypothetical protein